MTTLTADGAAIHAAILAEPHEEVSWVAVSCPHATTRTRSTAVTRSRIAANASSGDANGPGKSIAALLTALRFAAYIPSARR